jgi:hypothetical protein
MVISTDGGSKPFYQAEVTRSDLDFLNNLLRDREEFDTWYQWEDPEPLNHWDEHFLKTLQEMPVGSSKVFYYMSGSRKGLAVKLSAGWVRWTPPDVGDSNALVLTLYECVEQFGYH